ncbi:hypothetical protein PCASD_11721 [Puccinia coronata f. sp. avenae]|uniref:Uncharacterized protein n=1 Tax=Puccinia coronata f. sp. avenae TaxID=200324 RepID=A0A2N5UMD7_9BASI|nr:hypothetical protein PCASD_11721 [Puccinia coronata f. sp. avenae]
MGALERPQDTPHRMSRGHTGPATIHWAANEMCAIHVPSLPLQRPPLLGPLRIHGLSQSPACGQPGNHPLPIVPGRTHAFQFPIQVANFDHTQSSIKL